MLRKAQASMEFILSYGWILLIVIATIGTLMYFNFFNASKYLPDECEFGKNIYCEDLSFQQSSGNEVDINLLLKNNLEKPIEVTNVVVYNDENNELSCDNIYFYCPYTVPSGPLYLNWSSGGGSFQGSWYVGATCRLEALGCDQLVIKGYKHRFQVNISFKRQTPTAPSHSIIGRAFATVQ